MNVKSILVICSLIGLNACATYHDNESIKYLDDYTLCEEYGKSQTFNSASITGFLGELSTVGNESIIREELKVRGLYTNTQCRQIATSSKRYQQSRIDRERDSW